MTPLAIRGTVAKVIPASDKTVSHPQSVCIIFREIVEALSDQELSLAAMVLLVSVLRTVFRTAAPLPLGNNSLRIFLLAW
jgi:hypothetical protein